MAARIYSLAKELKIDSKELVEVCAKAGITGKGSALASLTDDEETKLRNYLSGKSKPPAAKPVARTPVPTLPSAPAPSPPPAPVAPVPTIVVPAVPAPAPAPLAPAPTPIAAVATSAPVDASAGPLTRDHYIGPGGTSGRPPALDIRRPAGEKASETKRKPPTEGGRPMPRVAPAIRLANMPKSQTPPPAASKEPAPQKPDIRLPTDVIRATKAGTGAKGATPLSQHIKQTEKNRTTGEAPGKPGSRGGRPGGPQARPAPMAEAAPTRGDKGRGGKKGVAVPGEEGALGSKLPGREGRQMTRRRVSGTRRVGEEEEGSRSRRPRGRQVRTGTTSTAAPRKGKVVVEFPCTVRSFSEALGVAAKVVQGKGLAMNRMLTIGAELDVETAEMLAIELGMEVEFKRPVDIEDQLLTSIREETDADEAGETRPPVITVLGHVDHGKTTLLDKLIGIDVASGESGGITQHIRAYQIEKNGRKISFVDTPGHEAFTEMRARGANVTDLAVLVVAADDGVMPQTEEAISHAKAAGVPIVVALNKMDLPGVNIDRIYQQLATNDLLPSEWGGDTEVVKTSAINGTGLDELLERLLTLAELHDYKANPARPAYGTCLEAQQHEGRGVVAKLIVQNGTLKVGDTIVCGSSSGRVKAMYDTLKPSRQYKEAGPSMPVDVTGLDEAPAAGEHFYVLSEIGQAREIAAKRIERSRQSNLGGTQVHVTLESLFDRLGAEEIKTLNIIVRSDVRGSIEALLKEFTKLEHPEVKIKVLQATVGGVTEADVHLADASDAVIIGFNVVPDEKARSLADQKGVQIRRYDIIYKVTEDLKKALEGLLKPEEQIVELGRALVLRTFTISRVGTIAGCRVLAGKIERNGKMRVIRDSRVLGEYPLDSLKREKDDAREVREGLECGIKLAGFNDVKEGDVLECYRLQEVARTL